MIPLPLKLPFALRSAPSADTRPILAALASDWHRSATLLKAGDKTTVLAGAIDGDQVVIKLRPTRVLDRALSRTHLQREWNGATTLLAANIPTATPLALCRGAAKGIGLVDALITTKVVGENLIDALDTLHATPDPALEQSIAKELATTLTALANARLWSRDFKPSNLILTPQGLTLLDTADIRIGDASTATPIGRQRLARMLSALVLEPTGLNCPPSAHLLDTLRAEIAAQRECSKDQLQDLTQKFEKILSHHGDPTPKHDPRANRQEPHANRL